MNEKKRLGLIISIMLMVSTFYGCSQVENDANVVNDNNSIAEYESIDTDIYNGIDVTTSNTDITTISTDTSETTKRVVSAMTVGTNAQETTVETTQVTTTQETTKTTTQATTTVPTTTEQTTTTTTADENLVQSISLDTYKVTLEVGETEMPIVSMSPSYAEDKSENWSSSNYEIATVDDKGNITGISAGTCTVVVQSKANPKVFAQISVTVTGVGSPNTTTTSGTDIEVTTTSENDTTKIQTPDNVTEPTYIDGILIVNKTYPVPKDYDPYNGSIAPEVQEAFNKMSEDASEEGLNLYISSGFRSYDYQAGLYERYANQDGYEAADKYSARAGYSEHQTGLCFDLNTIDDSFAYTDEGIWVAENCYKYGFIIRYPKGKEDITGYQYESWHLRYLGEELATKVYNSGLCLEEYLNITSKYAE